MAIPSGAGERGNITLTSNPGIIQRKAILVLPLADPQQIKDYLLSFDVYQGASQERIFYVNEALRRFLLTVEMTPKTQEPGDKLLELGASPYFLTLLLSSQRSYEIELANYFGDSHPSEATQKVKSTSRNVEFEFHYRNFNVERDLFPYPDDEFQIVLCCEIIEHLTQDPTAMLAEIHRVLKPGGYLLLTTPNILNLRYLLALVRGHNFLHPYSGYGVYGRHQREYTLAELTDLVSGCGFEVIVARQEDLHPAGSWRDLWKLLRPHRRDHLFVLARRSQSRRYYYPSWLYSSTHAIHRVVSSDVRMGQNDVGHLSLGWWNLEPFDPPLRWTEQEARLHLIAPENASMVNAEVCPGPQALGEVQLTLGIAGQESVARHTLVAGEWHIVQLPIAERVSATEIEVILLTDRTRCPVALGVGEDPRELGVMVRRIWVPSPDQESSTIR